VASGSAAALAGPAQAFDTGTCNEMFGSNNIASVDSFNMETGTAGEVDFADGPFAWWGAPLGNAVVCWNKNGHVGVRGILYADPFQNGVKAQMQIQYYCNGVHITHVDYDTPTISASSSVKSYSVWSVPTKAVYDKVRIQLVARLGGGSEQRRGEDCAQDARDDESDGTHQARSPPIMPSG
jgi:hypothetical protein